MRVWMICLAAVLLAALAGPGLAEGERVAILCEALRESDSQAQVVEKAEQLKEVFGYELTILECEGEEEWAARCADAAESGYDLILGVGPLAAPCALAQSETHESTAFAVVDGGMEAGGRLTAFHYSDEQAAYLIGAMAARCFPEAKRFGYIGRWEDRRSFPCRWGYAEGVRSVTPDARFSFGYTGGDDPETAFALALAQQSAGCRFIYGGASAANEGIFRAALERAQAGEPFYTCGQGHDATDPENPWVLTSQLKNTGVAASIVIDTFYAGAMEPGLTVLDMASGAIGAANITTEGGYRNEALLTDGIVEACRADADRIASGELTLTLPASPESYRF